MAFILYVTNHDPPGSFPLIWVALEKEVGILKCVGEFLLQL